MNDSKWKSRKLFVWIITTIIFIGSIILTRDINKIMVIIWGATTGIYLLGQTLIDFAKEFALKWLEKK